MPAANRRSHRRLLSRVLSLDLGTGLPPIVTLSYVVSSANSLVLLVISCLDLGMLSWYCIPIVAILTIFHHGAVVVLSKRTRKPNEPSFFWSVVLCCDVLGSLWLGALIVTIVVFVANAGPQAHDPQSTRQMAHLPTFSISSPVQIALASLQLILLSAVNLHSHLLIQTQGQVRWRKMQHDTIPTPFVNNFSTTAHVSALELRQLPLPPPIAVSVDVTDAKVATFRFPPESPTTISRPSLPC